MINVLYTRALLYSNGAFCKAPVLPAHSHIDEGKRFPGSYQCDSGYEPSELLVSKCLPSGD